MLLRFLALYLSEIFCLLHLCYCSDFNFLVIAYFDLFNAT